METSEAFSSEALATRTARRMRRGKKIKPAIRPDTRSLSPAHKSGSDRMQVHRNIQGLTAHDEAYIDKMQRPFNIANIMIRGSCFNITELQSIMHNLHASRRLVQL
ncbi:hypothetical protein OS493_027405 [Desmophyllum pertusum]|uniref:Uncharacterized protein n=1 Tax=Desmophyllum pertusum TaxID=174260 RepID=A0A9W9YKV0_9CNID|nr:hypothetical protein OS493_027405 [Desmophyllum pertusum]